MATDSRGGSTSWTASSRQPIEKHAERIDIGGGRDRTALQLFRCRVLRGQRAVPFRGESHPIDVGLQQLCNAEIE